MSILAIGVIAVLGLYMAWGIGANDFANSMADAVGSRAIRIFWAVIIGAICEFAGSLLVGMFVSDTLRKEVINPQRFQMLSGLTEREAAAIFVRGMASALLASAIWLHFASRLGMPVSTTHAIVGAVTGFGLAGAGWRVVDWGKMGEILASWVLSPVAGGLMAFLIFKLISWLILGREAPVVAAKRYVPVFVFVTALVVLLSVFYKGGLEHIFARRSLWFGGDRVLVVVIGISLAICLFSRPLIAHYLKELDGVSLAAQLHRVERVFAPLVISTSCSVAFAHGANDVANAVGPLSAAIDILRTGSLAMSKFIPLWILALGGLGIVVGVATYGYRVLYTVGTKIVTLSPSRGVAADLATAVTVLVCSRMKLPVSTTHTIVGAIIGIGLARGIGAVNLKVTRDIFLSWFVTVPAGALISILLFTLGRILHVDALIMGTLPS